MTEQKVIIVGGGLAGLVLAQGLKKNGIAYEIYERDESDSSRSQGLSLSIHWALPYIEKCMDAEQFQRIGEASVNPSNPDNVNFVIIDGPTGDVLLKLNAAPNTKTNKTYRMSRKKLREFLGEGTDINWNKKFKEYELTDQGVTVRFEDGHETKGSLLVGADGAKSRVADQLCGSCIQKFVFPLVFVVVTVRLNREQYEDIRKISSTHGVGYGPSTGHEGNYSLFFSMLDVSESEDIYEIIIAFTWLDSSGEHELAEDQASRIQKLKDIGLLFCEPFNSILQGLKGDEPIWTTKILEKTPSPWDNSGKVTLIGDAAHSMSMFRGEGKEPCFHSFRDTW
ncbi:hypothetical protein VKS41_009116 [Umbelopsis sp. WA50703]|jgi:2-polyprenyl-6-methoxyphenol hydroxylase-like FAD-dependent oxidoreductase